MKKIYSVVAITAVFILCSSFTSYSGRNVRVKNQIASNFKFNTLSGKSISLSDYRGKLVVLNFWASWAAPCLREMPNLQKLHETYKHLGVQVLGVAVVSKSTDIEEKVQLLDITYPVLLGDKNIIAKYGSFSDLPSTFIIDEKGCILKQLSGSNDYKTLEQEITPFLQDPSLTNR